jgi:hypothetical protein
MQANQTPPFHPNLTLSCILAVACGAEIHCATVAVIYVDVNRHLCYLPALVPLRIHESAHFQNSERPAVRFRTEQPLSGVTIIPSIQPEVEVYPDAREGISRPAHFPM